MILNASKNTCLVCKLVPGKNNIESSEISQPTQIYNRINFYNFLIIILYIIIYLSYNWLN